MIEARDILARQSELEAIRAPEESRWRQLARILRPDGQDFSAGSEKQRDGTDTFDSTPLYALENFVGGLFGQAVSPADRWFEFTLGQDPDLAAWRPVRAWTWQTANIIYASLSPAVSTFYEEAPAWLADTGAFGLGTLGQEEVVGQQRFIDRAVPLAELFIDVDGAGVVDTVHRRFRLTGRQAKKRWGEIEGTHDTAKFTFVHAVRPNPDHDPRRLGSFPYLSTYVSPDLPRFRRDDGGFYELPYHFAMWNRRSGRVYPTGPGHNAAADMLMLDEMQRSTLVAHQFNAEPIMLANDESVLSAADISPNALLYGTVSDQGKALLQYLTRGEKQLPQVEAKCEQVRNSIRQAFYYGMMQFASKSFSSATEFLGFQEENLRLLAPNLVKIQAGLSAFVARRYRLLARAGQIPPPPPELAGRRIDIEFVSPLAKAQRAATGRAVLQSVGAIAQLAALDGQVVDIVDADAAARVVHDALSGHPDVLRDPRDVAEIRKARAAAQQQQAQLDHAAQATTIMAEQAHAQQAATLAAKRGAR